MRRTEIGALGRLAADAVSGGISFIGRTHEGIASRPFDLLGEAARPARAIHDGVSRLVYAGLRSGLSAGALAASSVATRRAGEDEPALGDAPRGSLALGVLNGMHGDWLAEHHPDLALPMTVRRHRRDIPATSAALNEAFPDATTRVVVFVHGLCETDEAWRLPPPAPAEDLRPYGERLREDLGLTPVYLRYNTGRHVSDNGRNLAELLEALVGAWPRPVRELTLVGHSMGGLVARSACHIGERDRMTFIRHIRHVFCLGTPHLGADLEKGANVLAWALGRLPETRAIARVINARSIGIKDLRFGALAEEDWTGHDPDEFLHDRCLEVPFLDGAHYYFVGATLYPGPLGNLLGDLLVRSPSSSGRGSGKGRRIPFEVENGLELTGVHHFGLLNHPAVYEQLRTWVSRTPSPPRALLSA